MRTVLLGAAISAAAGLLMGAAARPDLSADERPEGPQIIAEGADAGSTGPFDDSATLANYKGQLPDYVLGTDWKRSLAPLPSLPEPREERLARNDDAALPDVVEYTRPAYTHPAYDEPPRRPPAYPSLQGGVEVPTSDPVYGDPGYPG